MIIREALAQVRKARAESEEKPQNHQTPKRQIEYDDEGYKALKARKKEAGDDFKTTKQKIHNPHNDLGTVRKKFSWSFNPGDLVKIKSNLPKNSYALRQIEQLNIYPGAVGVIVEEHGKYLKVMGPMGLQTWLAGWVNFCDE